MNQRLHEVIAISGLSSSGKTTLANMLSAFFGFTVINVGNKIQQFLGVKSVDTSCRASIGVEFFNTHDEEKYSEILEEFLHPHVIVDGVRVLRGIELIRSRFPTAIHIHRKSAPEESQSQDTNDSFAEQANAIELVADIVVPWTEDISELNDYLRDTLVPFCERRWSSAMRNDPL